MSRSESVIGDLTVHRRASAIGAQTSSSKQIATPTGTKIQIITPRFRDPKADWDHFDFDIRAGSASKYSNVQMEDLDEMISLGLDSEAVAVEVAWSPPGLSSMHDCLLAVLDSHHHVFIWQSTGIGNDNWSHICNLSDLLFELQILKDNSRGDAIVTGDAPLIPEQCRTLKIHSIAWSPKIDGQHSVLAIGAETGEITFWRFTRNQQPVFHGRWKLPIDHNAYVTHIAWSPIFLDLDSMEEANKRSILAASALDGSVHLGVINFDSEEIGSQITVRTLREVFTKQRIPVSMLSWHKTNRDMILSVARNGILSLSIHSYDRLADLSSEIVVCRHQNYSLVVEQDHLDILLVSQLLPLTSFRLSSTKELSLLPPPVELDAFFKAKHNLFSPMGTKNFFKIYGVSPSPNATVFSFYYDLTPNDRPQYRTPQDYRSRLSTTVIEDLGDAIDRHFRKINCLISGILAVESAYIDREVSPLAYAWEGKVLYETATRDHRITFINSLRTTFDPLILQPLEPGANGINDHPEALVTWQYWMGLEEISKISSDTSIPKDMQTRLQHLISTATSIIQNYIRRGLDPYTGNPVIRLSQQISAALLSNSEDSPECCGICTERINAKSTTMGSCRNSHVFERCSITLLTLSTPYVVTCRVCARKKLDVNAFSDDIDWKECVFAGVGLENLVAGFPEIERCIYCGGEWYRKY